MAELTIDETLNEIRVLDKGKEIVIKAKKYSVQGYSMIILFGY